LLGAKDTAGAISVIESVSEYKHFRFRFLSVAAQAAYPVDQMRLLTLKVKTPHAVTVREGFYTVNA